MLYETVESIKRKIPGNSDVVFGMEATGIYSLPLYSALKRDGYKVKLYNPIQTNGYRKINIRKTKTDTIDSAIIAEMLRHRLIKKYSVPSKLRGESFEHFYELVKKKSRSKISRSKAEEIYVNAGNVLTIPELDSVIAIEIKTLITQLELYDEQIQSVEGNIDRMMKQTDTKIMSIPGIADILGPTILGEIGGIERFSNVKKLVAFAGLDPVVSQSGRFENKSGKISKRGSPLLRHALFLAANTAIQNDENLKRFYAKKRSEGKHHFSALNAVAAKLLRIVYWVLKNNKEYQIQLN
jgi:transposase